METESQFFYLFNPFPQLFLSIENSHLDQKEITTAMETNAAEAATNRSYEDFEPYCKWLTLEGQVILEINLKGTY